MFTGIIEKLVKVNGVKKLSNSSRLVLEDPTIFSESQLGASFAINGVCLSLVSKDSNSGEFDIVKETLSCTNLNCISEGDVVNIERALPCNGRFEGHVVQGHVDGVGTITDVFEEGENRRFRIRVPKHLQDYVVHKGSIAIDGISLTLAKVEKDIIEVALIPITWEKTNLQYKRAGDSVNIECDILAKYLKKWTMAPLIAEDKNL